MKNSRCFSKKQRKASRHYNRFRGQYQHFYTPESVMAMRLMFGKRLFI